MSWASKRKLVIILISLIFLGLIAFWITYPIIFKKPTCFDGKQNGDETGIDCGGSCSRLCNSDVSDPIVLWSRAFPIIGNIYNLVAYVENQNKNAATENVSYEFRIYDANNKLIGRKIGETFLPPNQQFVIFEPHFDGAESQVKSVTFEFLPSFTWVKKTPTLQTFPVYVDNIILKDYDSSPFLSARLSNEAIYDLPGFDVIAILYDENHNAINVSKTHKDGLESKNNTLLLFTWPQAFPKKPVTQDILTQINPFSVPF